MRVADAQGTLFSVSHGEKHRVKLGWVITASQGQVGLGHYSFSGSDWVGSLQLLRVKLGWVITASQGQIGLGHYSFSGSDWVGSLVGLGHWLGWVIGWVGLLRVRLGWVITASLADKTLKVHLLEDWQLIRSSSISNLVHI